MKKLLIATTLALTTLAATPALAGDHFNLSLGFASPAPVYYEPAPVYYEPAPVVYYPPVRHVYYAPPRPYAYGYGYHRPHHRERVYVDAWNSPRYGYWR